jgi:putative transport protein
MGAFPPAAQQSQIDVGLGGFVAAMGLADGPAAPAAIQGHGFMLMAVGVVVTLMKLAHRFDQAFVGPGVDQGCMNVR